MTAGTIRRLAKMLKSEPDSTRIVTHGNYLHGPDGIYDLPRQTEFIYICCAMGGCSWQRYPSEYYERALFWNGEE